MPEKPLDQQQAPVQIQRRPCDGPECDVLELVTPARASAEIVVAAHRVIEALRSVTTNPVKLRNAFEVIEGMLPAISAGFVITIHDMPRT